MRMSPTVERPYLNRANEHVFVKPGSAVNQIFQVGDAVPFGIGRPRMLRMLRLGIIGPVGHEWTEQMLAIGEARWPRDGEQDNSDTGNDNDMSAREAAAFKRSGMSAEGWSLLDQSNRDLQIAVVQADVEHTGGGWFTVSIDGVELDKVKGKEAAEAVAEGL